jgi:hypothetical protein
VRRSRFLGARSTSGHSSAFRYPCPAREPAAQAAWGDSSWCGIPSVPVSWASRCPQPLNAADAWIGHQIALAIPQLAAKHSGARNRAGSTLSAAAENAVALRCPVSSRHTSGPFLLVSLPGTWQRSTPAGTMKTVGRATVLTYDCACIHYPTGAPATRCQAHAGVQSLSAASCCACS